MLYAAELFGYLPKEGRRLHPGACLCHAFKEEAVIEYAARVIEQGRPELAGKSVLADQHLCQRVLLKRRICFKEMIQVVDICLEMTVVVQPHGLFVDAGLQGVIGVGERGVEKGIVIIHVYFQQGFLTVYAVEEKT